MIPYPNIDPGPVLVSFGPVVVRWYGVMFLIGFVAIWLLARRRATAGSSTWVTEDADQLVFRSAIGAVIGGRLGWLLLHGVDEALPDPWRVLHLWEGGLSFHGALLGVFLAQLRFARMRRMRLADVFDFAAPLAPVSLVAVHMAKYTGDLLSGVPEQIPSMLVEHGLPPYPLPLYEAALEGGLLGGAMGLFILSPRPRLAPAGLLLTAYGCLRAVIELVRIPEASPGVLLFGWITPGQLLSLPVIAMGLFVLGVAYHRRQPSGNAWAEPAA
jgi:phosphatidylglycerol:prolipoprotein diacylglycerol transferase